MISISTDGGARGNPGPAGCAFVIAENGKVIKTGKYYLGVMTNNQAEYWGAILGLEEALNTSIADLGNCGFTDSRTIEVRLVMDSELIIKQLQGLYKVKNGELKVLHQKAKVLIAKFGKVQYLHVLRAKNAHADKLVNEAIDARSPVFKADESSQMTIC